MRLIFPILFLSGCFTTEKPATVVIKEPLKYEVRAGQWTSCWESCGRRDNLLSVTETACICRDGKRFVHAFPPAEKTEANTALNEPSPEVVEPEKPKKSVFEMLNSIGD